MANTAHLGLSKPDPAANVDEEFLRLQQTLDQLDAIIHALQELVANKAATNHTHGIQDIENLAASLAEKMNANQTFSLDDLTDVAGANLAPLNYILAKNADGQWVPSTAIAALGIHEHSIAEVLGLAEVLAEKANANAVLALNGGTVTGPTSINRLVGEGVRGMLIGGEMSNSPADLVNDISFDAATVASDGATIASDGAILRIFTVAAMTKRLDAAWTAGNNGGGRDAGAIADGTWHCFAILNQATYVADFLYSLSATAPTLPAGFTHFRRIGSIIRAGGVIRRFIQRGDRFTYLTAIADRNSSSELGVDGTTLWACSVPTGIKVTPMLNFQFEATTTTVRCTVSGGSAAAGGITNQILVLRSDASSLDVATAQTETLETDIFGRVYMRITISVGTITSGVISTYGWIDTRGRL